MRTFSVALDKLPPKELRPNSRVHWRAKMKPAQTERAFGFAYARAAWEGEPMRRAELSVSVRNPRRLDLDNVLASLKPFIDGLVDGGVIADDSPDCVYAIRLAWIGKGATRVAIELREVA